MAQLSEIGISAALETCLPPLIFTRSGSSFDPSKDVWEWTDGPFYARVDFRQYTNGYSIFVPALKRSLLPFAKGHSGSYVQNLAHAFRHFTDRLGPCSEINFTAAHISSYAATLSERDLYRLGTLSTLLQKWVQLALPGVRPECSEYLIERKKPGNKKGEAVRTRNPVVGPLSEEECVALYSAANAGYGRGELPLWTLLLMRLLFACGGRISQFSSLKVSDFDIFTSVLKLPQVKTGAVHTRISFLDFDISPQTANLIVEYLDWLRKEGYSNDSALFPESIVMIQTRRESRAPDDLFFGHCSPSALSQRFVSLMRPIAPPTSRLHYAPLPITTKRFRYTFGTRLAEEGASKILIADRLGHADLQHVDVYVAASPKIVENIDRAMGTALAPLARAFKGQLVEDEAYTTHKGAQGSRIIDFRTSQKTLGSCAGKGKSCAFNKPVACYTCFRFEPWLDAPHEKVLIRLTNERDKWGGDRRMAAVNDEPIRAVEEVIALCKQTVEQRQAAPKERRL
jgi:integrase